MEIEQISTDQAVLWQWKFISLNYTIVYTWAVMALLGFTSRLLTRRLVTGTPIPRGQNFLELLVLTMRNQIREISTEEPLTYLPFIGTLFLFIVISNLLAIVPGFYPPTASLSTTVALALCVFIAVPLFGIQKRGLAGYVKNYVRPTPLMLPFNVMGELSRTLALAVRLFGNVMSGTKIVAILLSIAPLVFPIIISVLGLITGFIQAYIFAVLAMVYIASATRAHEERIESAPNKSQGGS